MKVDVIQRAKEFAEIMHGGQKRKEGLPYITHPASVVRILEEILETWPHPDIPEEDIVFSVGWLHDTLVVRLVKLADVLHNVYYPYSLSCLPARSIQRKIDDCRLFYIPLAMETCPSIGYMLQESVDNYQKILGGKESGT